MRRSINLEIVYGRELDEIVGLWHPTTLDFTGKIYELSSNRFTKYVQVNFAPEPIRSIFTSVRMHYKAYGILEFPYLDLEFWDSHGAFYGSSFTKYSLECERLHFFSGDEGEAEKVRDLLLAGANELELRTQVDVTYRGYCVFRPTPSFVIGRAAIEFDTTPGYQQSGSVALTDAERNAIPFLTASQVCTANLLNASFTVNTPEFIQQDPNLGQCATASLWVATRLMSETFGTHHFRYGTITRQAVGGWNREKDANITYDTGGDDGGLSVAEIRNALAATGAKSFAFMPSAIERPEQALSRIRHEIYSFVESGFPVLMCLEPSSAGEGHVVAAVGHSLPQVTTLSPFIPVDEMLGISNLTGRCRHYLVSGMVDLYYAHDDAYGPFNRIQLRNAKENPLRKWFRKRKPVNETEPLLCVDVGRRGHNYFLKQVVVPTSPYVKNYAWQPMSELIEYFEALHGEDFKDRNLVFLWRSLLVEGCKFKRSITSRKYSEKLREWYATLHLPKYVWLYEVSIVERNEIAYCFDADPHKNPRIIAGEYLYDATCPSYDVSLLSERVYGKYRDHRNEGYEYQYDTTVKGYPCYLTRYSE